MRESNESDYLRATSISGLVKKITDSNRFQAVAWYYNSAIIAQKITTFKRGKQISRNFSVNQLFLDSDAKTAYDSYIRLVS